MDCYNIPRDEVREFFERFSRGVMLTEDYQNTLSTNMFVKDVLFEITFDSIH